MARRTSALAVAVTALCLASCAGDDEPASTPTTATPTTSTLVATAAPAPTPTATEAPTTTIDPAQELAAQVEADFREADRLGREASMDPFDPAKEAAAMDRRLGVIAENFAAKLADWRERDYALRQHPDVPASITIEVPAMLVLEGADVAEMQICEVNSWIVVEVGAGPGESDAVVDPDVSAARATVLLRKVDGTWKFEGASQIASWEGVTECPSD